MNTRDFKMIFDNRVGQMKSLLISKNKEYASDDDKLRNFRTAARKKNKTMAQVLDGMKLKHDVSLDDMIEGLTPITLKMIHEKITDDLNYLLLLEAIFIESYIETATKELKEDVSVNQVIQAMNNSAGVLDVGLDVGIEKPESSIETPRFFDISIEGTSRENEQSESEQPKTCDSECGGDIDDICSVVNALFGGESYKTTPTKYIRLANEFLGSIFKEDPTENKSENKKPVKKTLSNKKNSRKRV